MNVVFKKVRFNLDKEADRAAYNALSGAETSENRFIIDALNAYGQYRSEQAKHEELLRRVDGQIHKSLQSALFGNISSQMTSTPTKTSESDTEANGEIADDFLKSFM